MEKDEWNQQIKKYNILLKDQRWINLKNQIILRDQSMCSVCGSWYDLQVHHIKYRRDRFNNLLNPWEYDETELETLCKNCHKDITKKNKYDRFNK